MKTLIVDASFSKDSLSRRLLTEAMARMEKMGVPFSYLRLSDFNDRLIPLNEKTLAFRTSAIQKGDYSSPMFDFAKGLAEADLILLSSPFYDLSVSALLKCYIEQTMVNGLTFLDLGDHAKGLLKAKRLLFLSVSGYPFSDGNPDFATPYIEAIAHMWGIPSFRSFHLERKDVPLNEEKTQELIGTLEWLLQERN